MTDSWKDAPLTVEKATQPTFRTAAMWDKAPLLDDVAPPGSESEKVGRGLKNFRVSSFWYEGPLGMFDTIGSIASELTGEVASGLTGIVGIVAGGAKKGLDAALEGVGLINDWEPEGPMDTAASWQRGTSEYIGWEPVSKAGADIGEVVGAGLEKAVQGVKHIGAGYTGIANLALGDPDIAAMSVEDFLQTPDALAERVFEATKGGWIPLRAGSAAITKILPDLATVALPGARTTKIMSKSKYAPDVSPAGIVDLPGGYGGVGKLDDVPAPKRTMPDTGPGGRPIPESGFDPTPDIPKSQFDEIQAALESGDKKALFKLMEANPRYIQAFEALGIEFTPGMVAENAALRQVQSGLKSVPGSDLGRFDDSARGVLAQKADDLINREGSTNRMGVDTQVMAEFDRLRESFIKSETKMWGQLDEVIPRGHPIDLSDAADSVMTRVVEAGRNGNIEDGLKNVSRHDVQLFKMTHERVTVERQIPDPKNPDGFITETTSEWQYTEPKYAAVDNFRRKLGRGLDNRDDFSGADIGELENLYGQMAEAQGRVAKSNGYGDLWEEMNKSTVKRKELEAAITRTGRAAAGLIGRISQASSNLRKGIAGTLRQLMEDIPASQRAAVASVILEDMFYPGALKTGELKPSFVASYKALRRNPEAMDLIFDHLDELSKADFILVADAAEGFFRSLLKDNVSNTANAQEVIRQIQEGKTVMRVLGLARSATSRVAVVGQLVAREGGKGIKTAMKNRSRKAAEFLQSNELREAVLAYANDGAEAAVRILNGSRFYNQWYEYLSAAEKKRMAKAGGLIGWLISEEKEK